MKTYFLTGASGAIGSALVPILLEDGESELRLLLRADSDAALAQRLETLLNFWRIDRNDHARRQRIVALRGDATATRFALEPGDYDRLCVDCTHLIHSAGNVRMNLPIETARHSAVDAAKHIISLARSCPRLEKVEFVSTVGVAGRPDGEVPEDWILAPRTFHNTYEQSKAEAEALIRRAMDTGLPATIHRPSMVVGDTVSGRIIHFQVFYHLCEFLSGRRTLGLAPRFGAARLDIIPADHVARILHWSGTHTESIGRILHACSGPGLALALPPLRDHVRQAFRRHGRRLPPILSLPPGVFQKLVGVAAVALPREAQRAVKTLPVFLDYLATRQTFANHRTQTLLSPFGLQTPDPADYLGRVLDYYLETPPRR